MKIINAILKINPNAIVTVRGSDINTCEIEWLEGTTPIAKSDIEAKMTALENINKMKALRLERNFRLADCDWTRMDDNGLSSSKKTEWATYRQALRDLPASANPTINTDDELILSSVTWPTKPS